MKNVLKSVLIVLVAVSFVIGMVACGGGGSSPSAAAKAFYAAVEKGDSKAMEKVATKETVALVGMLGEKAKESVAKNGKIVKTEEEIDGDEASVTLIFESGETENLDLIKVDGKWLVNISK